MTASLYLLLTISMLFVVGIGVALWWAIFSGQFDDTEKAANAILFGDRDDAGAQDTPRTDRDRT